MTEEEFTTRMKTYALEYNDLIFKVRRFFRTYSIWAAIYSVVIAFCEDWTALMILVIGWVLTFGFTRLVIWLFLRMRNWTLQTMEKTLKEIREP